jgi:hypothetical protein
MSALPLLLAAALGADGLAYLRSTLAALPASDPVEVSLEHEMRNESGDEDRPDVVEGRVAMRVAEGPEGLRIAWGRTALAAAAAEARARSRDPEARTPTRSAMQDLGRADLSESLDAAAALLRLLEKGTLLEDRAEPFEGRPARLLVVRLEPVLGRRDRRYVKEIEESARIWLGPDGVPLAAERTRRARGRAFLVISFNFDEREELRYQRSGDRLLVARRAREASNSGGGERGRQRSVTTLRLEGSPAGPVAR